MFLFGVMVTLFIEFLLLVIYYLRLKKKKALNNVSSNISSSDMDTEFLKDLKVGDFKNEKSNNFNSYFNK